MLKTEVPSGGDLQQINFDMTHLDPIVSAFYELLIRDLDIQWDLNLRLDIQNIQTCKDITTFTNNKSTFICFLYKFLIEPANIRYNFRSKTAENIL